MWLHKARPAYFNSMESTSCEETFKGFLSVLKQLLISFSLGEFYSVLLLSSGRGRWNFPSAWEWVDYNFFGEPLL